MNNQIRRPDSKSEPEKRAGRAKSGIPNSTVHPLAASRAHSLAVQRLNSFGKSRKGVPMGERDTPQGWKISQVERLIDLPRRDIQRACYAGQGGACILEPADSTWGKRFYSTDDIAKLMLVKLYKDQGYCLPEIRDLLNRSDEQANVEKELSVWKARLEEELLEIELKLNRILALLAALGSSEGARIEAVGEHLRQRLPRETFDMLKSTLFETDAPHPTPEALDALSRGLDKPGIDLAIDLWAGPGSYDCIVNIFWDQQGKESNGHQE